MIKQHIFVGLITLGCLFVDLFIQNQQVVAQSYPISRLDTEPPVLIEAFSLENGLPVESITGIGLLKNGAFAFTSNDGLLLFDGFSFKAKRANSDSAFVSNYLVNMQLHNREVILISDDSESIIWVQDGKSNRLGLEDGLPSQKVHRLKTDSQGRLWIATDYGLAVQVKDDTFRSFNRDFKYDTYDVLPIDAYTVYAMTNRGLFLVTDNNIRLIHTHQDPIFEQDYRVRMSLTGSHEVLVAAKAGYLHFGSDHNLVKSEYLDYTLYQFLPLDDQNQQFLVRSVYNFGIYDAEKRSYTLHKSKGLIQGGGFYEYHPIWQGNELLVGHHSIYHRGKIIFTSPDSVKISGIEVDDYMNLWIAVDGRGLFKLNYSRFHSLPPKTNPLKINPYSLQFDTKGNFWIGTIASGLLKWDGNTLKKESLTASNRDDVNIRAIYQTRNGDFLASIWVTGLWRNKTDTWERVLQQQPVINKTDNSIEAIYEEHSGDYWIGSAAGLVVASQDFTKTEEIRDSFGNPIKLVRVITSWYDDKLILGSSYHGVWWADEKTNFIQPFAKNEVGNLIRDVYASSKDTVWFASQDKGLVRWVQNMEQEPEIRAFTYPSIMKDNSVHRILRDRFGFWWLTNNQGLYRVKKSELDLYLDGTIDQTEVLHFSEMDGLLHREMNGGVMYSGIEDENGWFWIPTQRGVNFFNPEDFLEASLTLAFSDVHVITQKNRYKVVENLELLAEERTFTVEFQLLNSFQRKHRDFSYRIVEQDRSWRDIGNTNSFLVSNLASGLQTLEIRLNHTSSTLPVRVSFPIYIQPFWYESPLILSGFFGLLGSLVALIIFGIIRSAKKKQDILNAKVVERTKELESQRKKTLEALDVVQKQALELQEIDSIKTEYFIRLTHELRTPLSLIKGPLELILEQLDNDNTENLKQRLVGIKQNTENIYNLIDKLLELYRFNLDSFTLKKEVVNLTQITRQWIDNYASRHPEESNLIQFSAEESHIRLELDPALWDIILTHILTISFSYLKNKEPLYVHVKTESGKAIVSIRNFAPQLTEHEVNQLFKLFYDTEEFEHLKGTGIGLSLAKKYLELMHGTIDIHTKDGIHEVLIHLPDVILSINLETPSLITETVRSQQFTDERNDGLPVLLIVDDNAEFLTFMTTLLGTEYHVYTAKNGFEALHQLPNLNPDVIVSDVMMPKMSGFEFARKARQIPGFAEIPLIFLTAKNTEQAIQEGLQTGAQAYLTKPVSNNILKAQIKALLRRESVTKALAEVANTQPDPFKVKIDELILRHLSDPQLSVESIADTLHMSKSSLYRKWVDVSPKEQLNAYIIRLRLEETIKLVKDNKLSFSEASFVCGFSNPSYFSRIFKKVYHCTPSEYIEKNT